MDKQTFVAKVAELLPAYKANDDVIKQLASVRLIALVGPTGAGKSTVCKKSGIAYVVGDTTRAPRSGETPGMDYNFRTDLQDMLAEIERGEYVQLVVQRQTEVYGTKASSFPIDKICAMSIIASVIPHFKALGFGLVLPVYITPPSYSEWMRRIAAHHDRDLEGRLMEAKDSLGIALADPSYVFLLNDDLEKATQDLRNIAAGKIDKIASARARSAASSLYEQLQKAIR